MVDGNNRSIADRRNRDFEIFHKCKMFDDSGIGSVAVDGAGARRREEDTSGT